MWSRGPHGRGLRSRRGSSSSLRPCRGSGVAGRPEHNTTRVEVDDDVRLRALDYALAGYPVLPLHSVRDGACTCGSHECSIPGKHPRLSNGLDGASRDVAIVEGWWRRWPDANVALITGGTSGLAVLDVDILHGGTTTLERLQRKHGTLPRTPTTLTGSGGR